jgi:hypothetical protein
MKNKILMVLISKKTQKFQKKKTKKNKKMYSFHAIKWKFCCYNLNVSFFKLWIKNEKNNNVACFLVTSQEIDNLKLKKTTISLFILYIFLILGTSV